MECQGRVRQARNAEIVDDPDFPHESGFQGNTFSPGSKPIKPNSQGHLLPEDDSRRVDHAERLPSSAPSADRPESIKQPSFYYTPAGKLAAIRIRTGKSLPPTYPEREQQLHSSPSFGLPVQHVPHSTRVQPPERLLSSEQLPPSGRLTSTNKSPTQTVYPYARPGNNQNRGRGRNNNNNNRRNQDSTSNMMEIGNFFVRAERALNAIQRRGQGRGSRRQGRGRNQPPAYPHLPPQ
jgi:hypothetical protein